MKLKNRLELVARKVPVCSTVCDVGTDHAHIPVFLVKNGICKDGIAIDIKEGPLLAAKENILKFGLGDKIQTRLGNGLSKLNEEETDTVIIAGMGGILISEILHEGLYKAKKAKKLILQPMNRIEILRGWLYQNGFEIYDEELVCEGKKIYNVICSRFTGEICSEDEFNHYIGKKLIEKKDPLLVRVVQKKINELNKIINTLQKNDCEKRVSISRYIVLKEKMDVLMETLN